MAGSIDLSPISFNFCFRSWGLFVFNPFSSAALSRSEVLQREAHTSNCATVDRNKPYSHASPSFGLNASAQAAHARRGNLMEGKIGGVGAHGMEGVTEERWI